MSRFEKLKETFNIEDTELNEEELSDTDFVESEPELELDQHDREMDEISQLALTGYTDMKELGENVEIRHSAEIFQSAATMLKISLDARNSKVDKRLRLMKLQLDRLRLDRMSPVSSEPTSIDGEVTTFDRNDLLKQIKEARAAIAIEEVDKKV